MPDQPSPLRQHLQHQSAGARREITSQPRFQPSDFDRLLGMLDDIEAKAIDAGVIADGSRGRLASLRRTLTSVLALKNDPSAEVLAPQEQEVYLAGLEIGQLAQVARGLMTPRPRFADQLRRLLLPGEKDLPRDIAELRFRLQFTGLCAAAGMKVEPDKSADALVDLSGWQVALVAQTVPNDNTLDDAARACNARLVQSKHPGIVVLEVSAACWPERRLLGVASDGVAMQEIQKRADVWLEQHADRVGELTNADFAFGLIAVVTIPTFNVATRHVAFSTTFRLAALCGEGDPRLTRLKDFARRFGRLA